MKISVLTIFPDFFGPAFDEGMIRAAPGEGPARDERRRAARVHVRLAPHDR
jgi:tRNA G37 N-methylase TrmD